MRNKPKKEILSNKQAKVIADSLNKMFSEIEKMCHQIAFELIPKEELNHMFLNTRIGRTELVFEIQMFNSETNTKIIRKHSVVEMLSLCQANVFEIILRDDIKKMYDESRTKINDSIIEIMI